MIPPRRRHLVRQGPLEAYAQWFPRAIDLQPLVRSVSQEGPCVWLDSARHHPVTGRWSILGWDPWLTLTARGPAITLQEAGAVRRWRANPWEALRQVLHRYQSRCLTTPVNGGMGLLGYLSYDLNRWIERLPPPRRASPPLPDMVWFGMRMAVVVDHSREQSWMVSLADPHQPLKRARDDAMARIEAWEASLRPVSQVPSGCHKPPLVLEATTSQAEFEQMVHRTLAWIRQGEIFQANVAQRFVARWDGSNLALYLALRQINPSPFACFLSWGESAVLGCSPERLIRVEEGWAETRPIAGTRPRGHTPQEDVLRGFELLMSEKERAEHIMLVDLARNDLGRVCRFGSIAADELMTLEEYSHVIHIVSQVSGQLRPGADAVDVIRAVFPGGTITGCPKVRCMELLRALEPVARGLYTGSMGRVGFDGSMDLNIAIRTMLVHGRRLTYHVGAGIVADSAPDREYHETLAKAQALVAALHSVAAPHVNDAGVR